MEAFMQSIYAFLWKVVYWIEDTTDMTMKWIGQWISPLYQWFIDEDFYVLILLGGIVVVGGICILMATKIPWFTKKEMDVLEGNSDVDLTGGWAIRTLLDAGSQILYALCLVWLIALGTAQGTNAYSYMWMEEDIPMSFFNFKQWISAGIQIPCVFVLARFLFSVVGGVIRLRFVRLLRFLFMTLEYILLGLTGGLIITVLNEIAASNVIASIVTIPIFFIIYIIPNVWFWTPPLVVLALIIGMILSPFIGLLNGLTGGLLMGGGGGLSSSAPIDTSHNITTVFKTVMDPFGNILYTTFDFFTWI